jgi:hypothetical protein
MLAERRLHLRRSKVVLAFASVARAPVVARMVRALPRSTSWSRQPTAVAELSGYGQACGHRAHRRLWRRYQPAPRRRLRAWVGQTPGVPCSCPVYRTDFITLGRVSGCGDRVCEILMSVASGLCCTRHTDPPVVARGPARHVLVPEAKPDVIVQDWSLRGCRRRAGSL